MGIYFLRPCESLTRAGPHRLAAKNKNVVVGGGGRFGLVAGQVKI